MRVNNFKDYLQEISSRGRTVLLPVLLEAQHQFGYISKEKAFEIGKVLGIPHAEISGVIEFYSLLHGMPNGEVPIRVCTSPICAAKGGQDLLAGLAEKTELSSNGSSNNKKYFLEEVACLGLCDHAPAVLIGDQQVGVATVEKVFDPIGAVESRIYGETRPLTFRYGEVDPFSLGEYLANKGFEGLKHALSMSPADVIEVIKDSGLRGRGGAGFPTGVKWEGAALAKGNPKYLVCNADESEPGTFKDRLLLAGDPFSILEGMLIAAYAVGAEHGYMYVRGEYPTVQELFKQVVRVSKEAGYLGENIFGKAFSFDIELRSGAGAYICGEETALFESIEGRRGFPRIKPPFPTTHGLFQKPTVINNVETLANVPLIFREGVEGYRRFGTEGAPGPRLFSVSGDVAKPGVYELVTPITIRDLIYSMAGGVSGSKELQAVLLGGAAGKFVAPKDLDIPLTHEATAKAGISLGSGAVMVFDETRDMKKILTSLGHFFAHESCGKCFPCQLGTQRQVEILQRNEQGEMLSGDKERLLDVGWTMTDASLCGLGQTAASAVISAIELWPEWFE